jgi:hypothetical protein
VALLIPFCVFLAARRSDAEDVTANNKPTANNNVDELHLELSLGIEHAREMIDEDLRAKSITHRRLDQQPEQGHLQYLDEPFIRLMLERAEKSKERPKSFLEYLRRDIARTPERADLHRRMERSRELER